MDHETDKTNQRGISDLDPKPTVSNASICVSETRKTTQGPKDSLFVSGPAAHMNNRRPSDASLDQAETFEKGSTGSDREINEKRLTLLHAAAWNGVTDMMQELIRNSAEVDARTKDGWTPLTMAANSGHLASVNFLLQSRADVNARNDEGRTPLFQAVEKSHLEVVKRLLEAGASPHLGLRDGRGPIFVAVGENRVDLIAALLAAGANPRMETIHKNTPCILLHTTTPSKPPRCSLTSV